MHDTTPFVDGLGRRVRGVDESGEAIEALRLCRHLSDTAATEAALIERVARLSSFSSPSFAPIRRIERLQDSLGGLSVVSQAVPGVRLSDVLRRAERKWVEADLDAALGLVRQIVGAVADLHRFSRDVSHGALSPERIVVKPDGRAVVVEHVLGSAIERLQFAPTRLWKEFRVAVPSVAGAVRIDEVADLMQLGMVALALVLGRPIRSDEFPQRLPDLLNEASAPDPLSDRPPLAKSLRSWILRAIQLEPRSSFRTAAEAATAFEAALAEGSRREPTLAAVVNYLAACPPAPATPTVGSTVLMSMPSSPLAIADASPCAVGTIGRGERLATVRVFNSAIPDTRPVPAVLAPPQFIPRPRSSSAGAAPLVHRALGFAGTAARASVRYVSAADWALRTRDARVAVVAVSLVTLFGVTYLRAIGDLGFPAIFTRTGTLVVESQPAGAELRVDGVVKGRTPVTVELVAGEHTLVLKLLNKTTLVPVTVAANTRRVERVELRQRRSPVRPPVRPPAPPPLPAPVLPQ